MEGASDDSSGARPLRRPGDAPGAPTGYNRPMTKFRIGIALGFAGGYYLGTKAGRERYVQINRWLRRVGESGAFGKARAVVDLGRERARTHGDGSSVDLTTDVYLGN